MKVFIEQERDDNEADDAGRLYFRTMVEVRVWHGDVSTMEEDLRALLIADPWVAASLGERVVWGARPQGEEYPCAVLHRITGTPDYHMQGGSGLVASLVQIDVWAETWLASKQAARTVKDVLARLY